MIMRVDDLTGSDLMRLWGVSSWVDPGAEYYLWNGCCIFALINQRGFVDIHMAMDKSKWHQCRMAGKEILQAFGHNKLRAVILEAHSKVINYARRMGFVSDGKGFVILADGTLTPSLIMWREPGEHNERSY